MNINNITARQILDSRGNPTVEAEVWCEGNIFGRASVPSGASTGTHEAHELRDKGDAFGGNGVLHAIKNIETEIKDVLLGVPADDQFKIDELMIELDGTPNKSRLGANAILAVSLAAAHAAARVRQLPLYKHINDIAEQPPMSIPVPMLNLLNGGQHALRSADFQEYMVMPIGVDSYAKAIQIGSEIFQTLKQKLIADGFSATVGDEGGFAPTVASNTEMLDRLQEACTTAGHTPGETVVFALDVAASEFFSSECYRLKTEKRALKPTDMIEYLSIIAKKYPVVSIEDGLAQDDWASWTRLTEKLPHVQLVGDDLLVTNLERLEKAIKLKAGNAILIKLNQIGTLSETIKAITTAKAHGWRTIVSHRSGETEDVTIAHLAVGTGADHIKTGSVSRGERTAKHNELIRIEDSDTELKFAQFTQSHIT